MSQGERETPGGGGPVIARHPGLPWSPGTAVPSGPSAVPSGPGRARCHLNAPPPEKQLDDSARR